MEEKRTLETETEVNPALRKSFAVFTENASKSSVTPEQKKEKKTATNV